jgi:hypothetical protein
VARDKKDDVVALSSDTSPELERLRLLMLEEQLGEWVAENPETPDVDGSNQLSHVTMGPITVSMMAESPTRVMQSMERHMSAIHALLQPFGGRLTLSASRDFLPTNASLTSDADATFFTGVSDVWLVY